MSNGTQERRTGKPDLHKSPGRRPIGKATRTKRSRPRSVRKGFTLVLLDGGIAAFSKCADEDSWRKRFEEDRVEERREFQDESVVGSHDLTFLTSVSRPCPQSTITIPHHDN
jgi:hypothetical protein